MLNDPAVLEVFKLRRYDAVRLHCYSSAFSLLPAVVTSAFHTVILFPHYLCSDLELVFRCTLQSSILYFNC